MSQPFRLTLCCLFAGFFTGLAASADGQILDTIEQCDTLFGAAVPPTEKTSDIRFYLKDGISIKVLFVDGKAEVITFTPAAGTALEDRQQQALLAKNVGDSKWEEVVGAGPRAWARADGEVFGFYDASKAELTIMTANYLNKAKDEVQTAAAAQSPAN